MKERTATALSTAVNAFTTLRLSHASAVVLWRPVSVLDPDAVFRIDAGGVGPRAREPNVGADVVARQVLARGRPFARFARPAIVNGAAGLVIAPSGKPLAVVRFTTARGRILAIELIADPHKLRRLSSSEPGSSVA